MTTSLIDSKLNLEITVYLLENRCFEPIVFCHDDYEFDKDRYYKICIDFFNILAFLDSCGISIISRIDEKYDFEAILYKNIYDEISNPSIIFSYTIEEIDYSNMDLFNSKIPNDYDESDFSLIKVYLLLKSGAALNKRMLEKIFNKQMTDSNVRTIRKVIESIVDCEVKKRKDNSYEMRWKINGK